jgi:internalin A
MPDYPYIRELRAPVTSVQLRPLDPRCRVVQFDRPLSDDDFQRVAHFMRMYPHVALRIYGHYDRPCDLEFLRYFPFLRRLDVDVYDLQSIDGLAYLSADLRHFGFGQTKKTFSLDILGRFTALHSLYLEGHTKHIEVIGQLTRLTDLTLRSITLPNLAILLPLRQLLSLDLKLGGTTDLSLLPNIGQLRYLELWLIRGLADLQAIADIATLQYLFLQALKHVTQLPSLAALHRLRRVHLETMKGLTDLTPVADAPSLKELLVLDLPQLQPDAFRPFIGHPRLKRVTAGLGSMRKNASVAQLLGLPPVEDGKEDFAFVA